MLHFYSVIYSKHFLLLSPLDQKFYINDIFIFNTRRVRVIVNKNELIVSYRIPLINTHRLGFITNNHGALYHELKLYITPLFFYVYHFYIYPMFSCVYHFYSARDVDTTNVDRPGPQPIPVCMQSLTF